MELAVKTLAGKSAGKITVDDAIFGIDEIRGDILQRTVRWQLAKRQAGTHKTQTRGEVSVTTKKYPPERLRRRPSRFEERSDLCRWFRGPRPESPQPCARPAEKGPQDGAGPRPVLQGQG
jgi:ribosomal protein L4